MPATIFTARGDGAALDDANVRHAFTRTLQKAECATFAFTTSGTRSQPS
jgi:hypothetical protein